MAGDSRVHRQRRTQPDEHTGCWSEEDFVEHAAGRAGVHGSNHGGRQSGAPPCGIVGVVVDGCIRDVAEIRLSPIACYARGHVPAGPHKGWGGEINVTVRIGRAAVKAGDLVICDEDGLTFIPFEDRAAVIERCHTRIVAEAKVVRRTEAGETTVEIMKLAVLLHPRGKRRPRSVRVPTPAK